MSAKSTMTEAQAAEALGIDVTELQAFRAAQAARPTLVGVVNKGEEVKYGFVTLRKQHANGYGKNFGLSRDQAIAARDFLLEVLPIEN